MPTLVTSEHPSYVKLLPMYTKCRDAFEGEDAIKARGDSYLPRLKGQDDEEYAAYKRRALFYSITSKSVGALVGMAMSKIPQVNMPDEMLQLIDGHEITQFAELLSTSLSEVLLQSRFGCLIDAPIGGGNPSPIMYRAEDIINWRFDKQGKLEFVVLREIYEHELNEFESVEAYMYRELRIIDGVYVQRVYKLATLSRTGTSGPVYTHDGDHTFVTRTGRNLSYIPFFVVHPFGMGFVENKPMMLDIANINISHYMSSADLEHGRHFTGLPTPVIMGADADSKLYIGSTKFLILPNKGSDAKYLEFTGQGLQSLEKAMSEKQSMLASLSARLLDNSTRGSEAPDAVKMRYMSETASLTTVVKSVEQFVNYVYKCIADVMHLDRDSVMIKLDTDFLETTMSAQEMTAIFKGYYDGVIDIKTLVFNLRRGRRLDPSSTDEDVASDIVKRSLEVKKDSQPGQTTTIQSGQLDQHN